MGTAATIFLIDDDDAEAVVASSEAIDAIIFGDEDGDFEHEMVFLEKSWSGIHEVLTGSDQPNGTPEGDAILGGTEVGEDLGMGPARLISADRVSEISDALSGIDFRASFERGYAEGTSSDSVSLFDGEFEYLSSFFEDLKDAYASAAEKGMHMLIFIG